jgi:hypothetical protein
VSGLVIAHRGASAREVENSLAAFRAAASLGADGVELDVHATMDGGLIVHHDEAIAGRPIPYLTTAQVASQRLSNGEPVPTLAAALQTLGPALRVFVEVKSLPPQFDDRLLAALDAGPNPGGGIRRARLRSSHRGAAGPGAAHARSRGLERVVPHRSVGGAPGRGCDDLVAGAVAGGSAAGRGAARRRYAALRVDGG